jgi:hypothetical protein
VHGLASRVVVYDVFRVVGMVCPVAFVFIQVYLIPSGLTLLLLNPWRLTPLWSVDRAAALPDTQQQLVRAS